MKIGVPAPRTTHRSLPAAAQPVVTRGTATPVPTKADNFVGNAESTAATVPLQLPSTDAPAPKPAGVGMPAFSGRSAVLAMKTGSATSSSPSNTLFSRLFGGTTTRAPTVAATPAFSALSAQQQTQLTRMEAQASPAGKAALLQLLQPPAGQTSVLLSTCSKGKTLLDHLAAVADKDIRETGETGVRGRDIMNDLLTHVADPGTVAQGDWGTCSVASMQYALTRNHPAEMARVVTDLALHGKAVLQDGTAISAGYQTSLTTARATERSHAGRLFQNAMMQQFAPPGFEYTQLGDCFVNMRTRETRPGSAPTDKMDDVWAKLTGMPVPERIARDENDPTRRDPAQAARLYDLLKTQGDADTLLSMVWSTSGHIVAFEGMQDDRVLIRDPNGKNNPSWMTRMQLDLKVVDDQRGVLSMGKDAFIARLQGVFIPQAA